MKISRFMVVPSPVNIINKNERKAVYLGRIYCTYWYIFAQHCVEKPKKLEGLAAAWPLAR